MNVVLIANLGTSDVKFDGKYLKDRPRSQGAEILNCLNEDFSLFRQAIEFPILEPIINELGTVDLLILLATDQHQGTTRENFWEKDTIYVADIIKTVMTKDDTFKKKVKDIEILTITSAPNNYDVMFKEYQGLLQNKIVKIVKEKGFTGYNDVYISVTAGTPACNLALMYSSIHENQLGFKQFVYTSEGEQEEPVKYLQLGRTIQGQQLIQLSDQFLRTYNYEGLLEFTKEFDDFFRNDDLLTAMIEVLHYRKNFRFGEASKLLQDFLRTGKVEGQPKRIFRIVSEEVNKVQTGISQLNRDFTGEGITQEIKAVIAELFWNATICYETGHYVDFLGRFWRLQESLLRLVFEEKLGINAKKENSDKVKNKVRDNSELLTYLRKNGVDLNRNLNRFFYYHTLKFFLKEDDIFLKWVEKGDFGENSDKKIVSLRNKSILGHEFEGVNKKIIAESWYGDILGDTQRLLENYFGIQFDHSGINEAHKWILDRISKKL